MTPRPINSNQNHSRPIAPIALIGLLLALLPLTACIEERVIYDNSIDAKLNRSIKPGWVHKGGEEDTGPKFKEDGESRFLGINNSSQWKSNLQMDTPPTTQP